MHADDPNVFVAGAEVVVLTLAKRRGRIVAVGNGNRYRVQVDGATMWCRGADLARPPDASRKRRTSRDVDREPASVAVAADTEVAAPPRRIDLHGLTVEAALSNVVDAIDATLRAGGARLDVVHGKGAGRLSRALHRHLAQLATSNVVKSFALDARNAGITHIYF